MMSRFLQIVCLLVSFCIVGCAQPDVSVIGCVLASSLGYALFWRGILEWQSKKKRFIASLIWFAAVESLHLNWFFSDLYVGVGIYFVVFGVVVALGLQFACISVCIKKKMGAFSFLALAGGWTVLEWSRLYFLSGFSWDPVGLTLSATSMGMQAAALFGIFGLSFWVIYTNLWGLHAWMERSWRGILCWGVVVLSPYLFGALHLFYHTAHMKKEGHVVHALVVQTALYPEEKYPLYGKMLFSPFDQWERILALLSPFQNQKVDFILFPEATVPYGTEIPIYATEEVEQALSTFFDRPLSSIQQEAVGNVYWAQQLASLFEADVVIGLEDQVEHSAYNAAFLVHPHSHEKWRYEKRVLVPLAEYIPFDWCKKFLLRHGIADSFTPGKEAKLLPSSQALLGVSICYEETYAHLMREARLRGAELFVNLSNDAWYPRSRLAAVHFCHGRLRAVEGGIPLIRACNTGVSCGVDSLGRVIGALDYECKNHSCQDGVLLLTLPLYSYATLYTFLGNGPLIFLSTLFILVEIARKLLPKRGKFS